MLNTYCNHLFIFKTVIVKTNGLIKIYLFKLYIYMLKYLNLIFGI